MSGLSKRRRQELRKQVKTGQVWQNNVNDLCCIIASNNGEVVKYRYLMDYNHNLNSCLTYAFVDRYHVVTSAPNRSDALENEKYQ